MPRAPPAPALRAVAGARPAVGGQRQARADTATQLAPLRRSRPGQQRRPQRRRGLLLVRLSVQSPEATNSEQGADAAAEPGALAATQRLLCLLTAPIDISAGMLRRDRDEITQENTLCMRAKRIAPCSQSRVTNTQVHSERADGLVSIYPGRYTVYVLCPGVGRHRSSHAVLTWQWPHGISRSSRLLHQHL